MRYQNDDLAKQHDVLYEKQIQCKEHEKHVDPFSYADIEYTKNVENELSLFKERFLSEPMVFESDELSILLQILKNNFKESFDPAYYFFENGNLRRPVLNDEERALATHVLTSHMDTFTGRVGVHNWSSVDADNFMDNVTVSIERRG